MMNKRLKHNISILYTKLEDIVKNLIRTKHFFFWVKNQTLKYKQKVYLGPNFNLIPANKPCNLFPELVHHWI